MKPLLPRVAYFCMEYGLSEDLPIYAGGLGVLAGDYVKSAGDLKMPLVAIGIFWSQGYTVQRIGRDGLPHDEYPPTSRDALATLPLTFSVDIRGKAVPLIAHRVTRHTHAPLYLLEPAREEDRWITRRLYGGGAEDRVAQEIILGVGGVRLLRALGHEVDVYHFNEGHAVFAGLELVRERMASGEPFEAAWQAVRRHVVFTTHTPVVAGNESHGLELLHEMGADLGVFSAAQLEALGGDPFGMTVAGLRLARVANGVAELHGHTSRKMWSDVEGAAPIVAVTNGVHPPTWQDPRIREAYGQGGLFEAHQELKRELADEVQRRTGHILRLDRLVVGFARRAAPYKRSDLIVSDAEYIEPLLREQRLQVVFAGKAHPRDLRGKEIVANLADFSRRYPGQVIFLENYDLRLGRLLSRGVDVWLNNPRRPMEASGTSGMKAAMNGVLNLSVLDGWWPEGCMHGVNGWQIGDGFEADDPELPNDQDEHDLRALQRCLVDEVLPTYETSMRARDGVDGGHAVRPGDRWVTMMRASIEMAQWRFSSDRMLEEYYTQLYREPAPPEGKRRLGSEGPRA
jgi:starch phosphorylase